MDSKVTPAKLEEWKYKRAEAKAMIDSMGHSLTVLISHGGTISWVQKYRYYDSLINSFKDLSK